MKTDITVLLDRSGSMGPLRAETIGSFNRFVEEQAAVPGECALTLVQFDDRYEPNYAGKDIHGNDLKLNADSYVPRGYTALLDAACRAIDETGERLKAAPAEKVIFVIITDGQENASKEQKKANLLERIKHQTDKYKWEFVFLGANQDAIAEGQQMGIPQANSLTYAPTAGGTKAAYASLSNNVRASRTTGASMAWSPSDRDKQKKQGIS